MSFFDLGDVREVLRGDEPTHKRPIHGCDHCKLFAKCKTPKASAIGEGKKRILILGEPMNTLEDTSGNRRHGSNHTFLKEALKPLGLDLERDFWYTHSIKCYTKEKITDTVRSACHRKLMLEIIELDPLVIIPTCKEAMDVLLYDRMGGRAQSASFYDWAGEWIPDHKLKRWIAPIYELGMVLGEMEKHTNKFYPMFPKMIEHAVIHASDPVPVYSIDEVEVLTTSEQVIEKLEDAYDWKYCAIDYETTGLKPHRKGHEITHASISNGKEAYGFPFFNDTRFLRAWGRLLTCGVPLIAHNASFEREWSTVIAKVAPKNLEHDTAIAQHCLFNKKPAGQKFIAYARYGILGYDDEMDEYMKASAEDVKLYGGNAFNRMKEAPVRKASKYCGADSLICAWMYRDIVQKDLDKKHQLPGYLMFMDKVRAFDWIHNTGFNLDMVYMEAKSKELNVLLTKLKMVIMENELIKKKWFISSPFNPSSDQDVRILAYTILKAPVEIFTDKGIPAVDEEALLKMQNLSSIIPDLLEYRRWYKVVNTYFAQFKREAVDGVMRAQFKLLGVATFRPSISAPNLANITKRDKEVMEVIRKCIKPKKGHKFVEYDVKALEVCINAALSGDKNLIRYVSDPSSDMHKDLTTKAFFLDVKDVPKALRNVVKNKLTFPEFYGSSGKKCAHNMWEEVRFGDTEKSYGFNVWKHLNKHGITDYNEWEAHIVSVENYLWTEMFPEYMKYRKRLYESFSKNGYIDYPNGFRYKGPASFTESTNGPTQGSGFHAQLWAFGSVCDEIKRLKMDVFPVNNVYDSMSFSCNPLDEDRLDSIVYLYGCKKVKEFYPWINVPIVYEKEVSAVDGNWAEMSGAGELVDKWSEML